MFQRGFGIDAIADRRYYHFIVLRGGSISVSSYWNRLGKVSSVHRMRYALELSTSDFTIEHRKICLERSYARGGTSLALSEHGKGRPPFFYDLFAAQLKFRDNQYLL